MIILLYHIIGGIAMAKRRFGILTSGGDCPGLNATIRGAVRSCETLMGKDNVEFVGIYDGYHGLIHDKCKLMTGDDFRGIYTTGGTVFGSKRTPHKMMTVIEDDNIDKMANMKANYAKRGMEGILVLGGKGTHKTANLLSESGLNIIGLPKTIDNDIFGTDVTFGFHTAVEVGTEAIDRIHTTAYSHKRVMVIEIMGNKVGWLALYAGLAGGADVILIPEIPYEESRVLEAISRRADAGSPYSIVVVAEGALSVTESLMKKSERAAKRAQSGSATVTKSLTKLIEEQTGLETRSVVPGHILRGGTPSAHDRILSTSFGAKAAELLNAGQYGTAIAKIGNTVTVNKLSDIAGKTKPVETDSEVIKTAKNIGTSFGV
jgi:6-phosphofructokinase 1